MRVFMMKRKSNILILFSLGLIAVICVSSINNTALNLTETKQEFEDDGSKTTPNVQSPIVAYNWTFDNNYYDDKGTKMVYAESGATREVVGGVDDGGYLNNSYGSSNIGYDAIYDGYGFSIEFWFRSTEDWASSQNIVKKESATGHYNYLLARDPANSNNHGLIRMDCHDDTMTQRSASNANNLEHNKWQHIVMILDTNRIAYYLNGKFIDDNDFSPNTPSSGNYPIYLGDMGQSEMHFDNLVIWDGILSDQDVKDRYTLHRPFANFTFSPEYPKENDLVSFDATSTYGGKGPYVYDWDFGDENIMQGAGPTPTNVYDTEAGYTIQLNVTDANGYRSSISKSIYVQPGTPTDDTYEPNDGISEAVSINPYNQMYYGGLIQLNRDYWKVGMNSGDKLLVRLTSSSDLWNFNISEIDSGNGDIIRTNDSASPEDLTLLFPRTPYGTEYLIMVDGEGYGANYDLDFFVGSSSEIPGDDQFEENDHMGESYQHDGDFAEESLMQFDEDWFDINSEDGLFFVEFKGESNQYLKVEIYNSAGTYLTTYHKNSGSVGINITHNAEYSGQYFIVIKGDNNGALYDIKISDENIWPSSPTNGDSNTGGDGDPDDRTKNPEGTNSDGSVGNPFAIDGFPFSYTIICMVFVAIFLIRKKKTYLKQ